MSQIINFTIDLGTTNSLISKYNVGKIKLFKNPLSLKRTLSSVMTFRKEHIIVGDKALARQNYRELKSILFSLNALLQDSKLDEERIKNR